MAGFVEMSDDIPSGGMGDRCSSSSCNMHQWGIHCGHTRHSMKGRQVWRDIRIELSGRSKLISIAQLQDPMNLHDGLNEHEPLGSLNLPSSWAPLGAPSGIGTGAASGMATAKIAGTMVRIARNFILVEIFDWS